MTDGLVDVAADAFAAALVQWRLGRGLTKKQLAAHMGFDPSYVSHVEARRHRPTEDFARRAESVLRADGAIWQRFREYDEARQSVVPRPGRSPVVPEQRTPAGSGPPGSGPSGSGPPGGGLLVEAEHSRLTYVSGSYRCVIRRDLFNAGTGPVTRYPVRIAVDRYPGEPDRSNRHYHDHPLTWSELNLDARAGDEPMRWRPSQDRDAYKELWLLFENEHAHFPLQPGERVSVEHAYTVGEDKWGSWFQRSIRIPTRHLSVHLDFPADLRPIVWGEESSLTAEAGPLPSAVIERPDGDRTVFDWSTPDPPLNSRFRLEWRFRADPDARASGPAIGSVTRPSEAMRAMGIVQRGAPVLERAARWFDLPEETSLAEEIVGRLLDALLRVGERHDFAEGVGLSAPQLGIGWAAAIVRPPRSAPVVLLNPRIVGESVDLEDQFEGCLSFVDVRGVVARPRLIEVEHTDLTGRGVVSTFTDAAARLVAHEVDHVGGLLYPDRMPADARLIPVDEYLSGVVPG